MKLFRAGFGFAAAAVLILAAAPVPVTAQAGLPAIKCKDGTSTQDRIRPCDKHGGVVPKPPVPAGTKPATNQNQTHSGTVKPGATLHTPGKATATCKDGTKSYAVNHSGACSGHGGVAEWLDGTVAKKP